MCRNRPCSIGIRSRAFGLGSTSTSAMISVVAGLFLVAAILFNWRSGVMVRWLRRGKSYFVILGQDIIALLFRDTEQSRPAKSIREIQRTLIASPFATWLVTAYLRYRGWVQPFESGFKLTEQGRVQAQSVVRSHRLWEQYLATTIGWIQQNFTNRQKASSISRISIFVSS